MTKYQNEAYTKGSSKFIQVDPVNGTSVEFRSKVVGFRVDNQPTKALNFSVKLEVLQDIVPCDESCVTAQQVGTMELRTNVQAGTDVAVLKTELDRLYAKARDDYFLHDGLVPNVNADLDTL